MSDGRLQADIAIVGAGPAGLAAACSAAESGRRVVVVDDTPWFGGQIWRGQQGKPDLAQAQRWLQRFKKCGATLLDRTTVMAIPAPGVLLAERDQHPLRIECQRSVLATGARELFLPFPGWTLPGVMGPGGLLSLAKNGWPVAERTVIVAGTGPLLLAAASGLHKLGAKVVSIAEQVLPTALARFALHLWANPAKLWEGFRMRLALLGVRYQYGVWPVRAEGDGRVQRVMLTDGRRTWAEACDLFACGFGLAPNIELPLLAGCHVRNGFVQVDEWQATAVPNVYCAGEPTGVGGADCALVEGQIAGYAASGQSAQAESLFPARAAWHRFRARLATAFALRPELKTLARDDTVLCRCEDIIFGRVRQFTGWREAKLQSRCGMGPCQGRVCGAAARVVLGWTTDSVRPPVVPAQVASLISESPPGLSAEAQTDTKKPRAGQAVDGKPMTGPACARST